MNTTSRLAVNRKSNTAHIVHNNSPATRCGIDMPVFGSPVHIVRPEFMGFAARAGKPFKRCGNCFTWGG